MIDISITETQITEVEKLTRQQALDKKWFECRSGRITASKMYAVCHTDTYIPSHSLIKSISYPESYEFKSTATTWGSDHENDALKLYKSVMSEHHVNFTVKESGFWISLDHPFIGATPDALISCDCCGEGCVEIKCPYNIKEKFLLECNRIPFLQKNNDIFHLQHTHAYFYQIQTQLHVCNLSYCDFFVWIKKDYHLERFSKEEKCWADCVRKGSIFFSLCILPELIGKFYSRPPEYETSEQNKENISFGEELYCYCRKSSTEDLITCKNQQCVISQFHQSCLKIQVKHKGKGLWYCPDCQKKKNK